MLDSNSLVNLAATNVVENRVNYRTKTNLLDGYPYVSTTAATGSINPEKEPTEKVLSQTRRTVTAVQVENSADSNRTVSVI